MEKKEKNFEVIDISSSGDEEEDGEKQDTHQKQDEDVQVISAVTLGHFQIKLEYSMNQKRRK